MPRPGWLPLAQAGLRSLRIMLGLTQRELADRLRVSPITVGKPGSPGPTHVPSSSLGLCNPRDNIFGHLQHLDGHADPRAGKNLKRDYQRP